MKKVLLMLFLVLALVFVVVSPWIFSAPDVSADDDMEKWEEQLRKYSRIYTAIKNHYPREFDTEKLVYASIEGFLRTLDPHSYFLDPVSVRSMSEEQQGNYYGIGTRITKYEDRLTIIAPIKDTPAFKLGILAGDVIVTIDGEDTKGLTIDEAMQKLRGAKDSYVNIEIMRDGINTPIPFRIQRAEIPLESISYGVVHPSDKRIGFISIRTFGNTTADEFREKMKELVLEHDIKAVILDLRGNVGGSLYAAVDIADFFLRKGKVIVAIKGRTLRQNFIARKDNQYENIPAAVLINRGSASASEIVASALQDHHKAIIIGTRSWGKGLVQTVHKLALSSSLALTTAKYYTPTNKCIQRDFSKLDDYLSVLNYGNYDKDTSIEGGVIPDFYVKGDTYPPLLVTFISRGVFFQFSRQLIDNGVEIPEDFKADDNVIQKFKQFLINNKINFDPEEFDEQLPSIKYEIERDVISNKFSPEKGLNVFLESDPVTAKAVAELQQKLNPKQEQKGVTHGKTGQKNE